MSELKLSLNRKEVSVTLSDENGAEKKWLLRELSGAERDKYLNKMTGRAIMKDGKPIGMKSFDGFQTDLLVLSLTDSSTGDTISREEIEELPASTQQILFEKAQELSGLDLGPEDIEKNG